MMDHRFIDETGRVCTVEHMSDEDLASCLADGFIPYRSVPGTDIRERLRIEQTIRQLGLRA